MVQLNIIWITHKSQVTLNMCSNHYDARIKLNNNNQYNCYFDYDKSIKIPIF